MASKTILLLFSFLILEWTHENTRNGAHLENLCHEKFVILAEPRISFTLSLRELMKADWCR